MRQNYREITILIADNNTDDRSLVNQAFQESGRGCTLVFIPDGIELIQYLHQQAKYAEPRTSPRPTLILLDLDLPRKDGRLALAEIKADADLRSIPVVILTRSCSEFDILHTYELGGAGFIVKPNNLTDMIEVVKVLNQYWFEVVELSSGERMNTIK